MIVSILTAAIGTLLTGALVVRSLRRPALKTVTARVRKRS